MKLTTSIIETFAYTAKIFAITFIFMWLKTGEYLLVVIAAILWAVGYALNRWELNIESKRSTPIKHYDYYVLRTIGWIILVGVLLSYGNPYSHVDWTIKGGNLICSIFLIVSGGNRKSKYKKLEESMKEQIENEETEGV